MHTLDQQTGHRELPGETVIVSLLNADNRDEYLATYKTASTFAAIYEKSEDVWEHMHRYFGTDKDFAVRYLILEKDIRTPCGFLNYENQGGNPALDIAIAPAYRQKGYGFDAARTLCRYLLSQDDVEKIIWNVLPSNIASVRIAEKLGGKQIPWPDMISEAFDAAFGDTPELEDLPSTITYAITQIEK